MNMIPLQFRYYPWIAPEFKRLATSGLVQYLMKQFNVWANLMSLGAIDKIKGNRLEVITRLQELGPFLPTRTSC
jgi:hypothetical protein